jgi:prepilin-type N-terminal cleavage/methylation domain-containing protein
MSEPTRAPCMRRTRRAFTLIEVITAITLTAIVITIAASALAAASDARARIQEHRLTLEAESRWRAMVGDMLRHAPAADAVDEPLLRIVRTSDGAPTLTFLSTGLAQPFGTGRIWRVSLSDTPGGISLDAETTGRGAERFPVHSMLPHLRLVDVAVVEEGAAGGGWRDDWPVERSRPALVRMTFTGSSGSPTAPLLVHLSPVAGAMP